MLCTKEHNNDCHCDCWCCCVHNSPNTVTLNLRGMEILERVSSSISDIISLFSPDCCRPAEGFRRWPSPPADTGPVGGASLCIFHVPRHLPSLFWTEATPPFRLMRPVFLVSANSPSSPSFFRLVLPLEVCNPAVVHWTPGYWRRDWLTVYCETGNPLCAVAWLWPSVGYAVTVSLTIIFPLKYEKLDSSDDFSAGLDRQILVDVRRTTLQNIFNNNSQICPMA